MNKICKNCEYSNWDGVPADVCIDCNAGSAFVKRVTPAGPYKPLTEAQFTELKKEVSPCAAQISRT